MSAVLQNELDSANRIARIAYRRFMTAGELLLRHGLSRKESEKAKAIHLEAFETLTISLSKIDEICGILHPISIEVQERQRAPRYSTDARRVGRPPTL